MVRGRSRAEKSAQETLAEPDFLQTFRVRGETPGPPVFGKEKRRRTRWSFRSRRSLEPRHGLGIFIFGRRGRESNTGEAASKNQ